MLDFVKAGPDHYRWNGGYRESIKRRNKKLRTIDKIKLDARSKVYHAIKSGKLVRGSCSVCKKPNADAHHEDYSKPLDIVWVCRKHHAEIHYGGL